MAPIIHTVNLCKVYAVGKERVVALNDVSISIAKKGNSAASWASPAVAKAPC